jgi:putative tryptophan/tyrosine transport system substrate-binding protein
MKRREFITLLSGATVAWPLAARAQQKPVIGFLNSGSADAYPDRITAFHQGLRQLGYVDGENVVVIYRWALGEYDRLPKFAAELVERRVSVLVATGGEPAALAAKSATSTIPIVFAIGGDPIKLGLVASYNRPGGNATGANILAAEMDGKRLGLLHELMPNALRVGVLLNPNFPAYTEQLNDLQHAAKIINLQVEILRANTDGEIDAAFEFSSQKHLEALVLTASPFFDTRRDKLVALAAGHALPTIYHFREFAVAGGLMSYGVSIPHIYRQIGVYAGRILKGDNPANLPVQTPTKFELVINLKTAKMLRLTIPQSMLLVADEVIE